MLLNWFKRNNSRSLQDGNFSSILSRMMGFKPLNLELYRRAFTHSSVTESGSAEDKNERLEYLGDAVLGAIVSDYLYRKYPQKDEGFLTNLKSKLVSRKSLNKLGLKIGIKDLLKSNLGPSQNSNTLVGNGLEAFIGAIYLDRGYGRCQEFVVKQILEKLVDLEDLRKQLHSYKSAMYQWSQRNRKKLDFKVVSTEGENHQPKYTVELYVYDEVKGVGSGSTKKAAEEKAAKNAFQELSLNYEHYQT